jgi:hypothetical protein
VLVGAIVPHPGAQAPPFCVKVHVTPAPAPLFVPSFVTVAVNCWVALTGTLAEVGVTDTEMGKNFMGALVLAIGFVTEVATNATLVATSRFEGAV